jgi:hypothetical protein
MDPWHKSHRRHHSIAKFYLEKDERVYLAARQSHFESITPTIILVTNKKVLIIRPSFWKLYFGFDLLHETYVSFVPYNIIKNVNFAHGRILCSLSIKAPGVGEVIIPGLRSVTAKPILDLLENVVEATTTTE